MPAPNPRAAELHAELGIDKVVLVKSPFVIDTTPGGFHDPNASVASASSGGKGKLRDSWAPGFRNTQTTGPVRDSVVEYSSGGSKVSAVVDGRLLRGGWAVSS